MSKQTKWNADKVTKAILKETADNLKLAGSFVEGNAKLLCPVDLSNLRSSINHRLVNKKRSVRIGTQVDYAIFVEEGTGIHQKDGQGRKTAWFYYYDGKKGEKGWRMTRGQKPQPFLKPALMDNKKDILKIMEL